MDNGGGTPVAHRPHPVQDASLVPTFEASSVKVLKKGSELDDLLAFEGDDICIYTFSTSIDDELNRMVV